MNKKGMVQGRGVDASLNETGVMQAQRTYDHLASVPFEVVFTSKLIRTHQTAKAFIDAGLAHCVHEGFDEISWGDQEGVEATLEARNLYAETVRGWQEGKLELNVGGGENPLEVMHRQQEAMKEVLAHKGSTILVCMHGRAIRILLCWLLNYPLNYMDGFPHNNCAYYKLVLRNEEWFVDGFNVQDHLIGI